MRPLRLALAFVALLAACALPAHAQETPAPEGTAPPADPQIVVKPVDGSPDRARSWSELSRSLDVEQEAVLMPDGTTKRIDGLTVRALLERFSMAETPYSEVRVPKADLTELVVTQQQVLLSRFSPARSAIVFMDDDGWLKLVRPAGGEGSDTTEIAAVAADGRLVLTLVKGAAVTANTTSAYVGERITFTVAPPPGFSSDQLSYEWDFNDGSPLLRTDDRTVTHAFERTGAFNVSATIYVDGQRWRPETAAPFVEVGISEVSQERSRRRSRDARQAGDRERDPEAGGGDPDPGPTGGLPDGDGGGPLAGAGPSSTPEIPSTPAATPPPPAAQPQPRAPPRRAQAPAEPEGETVTGYLLASADGQPLPAGGSQRTDRQPLVAEAASTPLEIPALAWVLAGLAALVVLGWALESRTTLPYFRP